METTIVFSSLSADFAYTIAGSVQIEAGQTNVEVSSGQSEIVIGSNTGALAQITVPSGVTNPVLNVASLVTTTADGKKSVTLPNSSDLEINVSTALGIVAMTIAPGTTIIADSDWNGIINLPRVESNSSVTIPAGSGKTTTVSAVIEVGAGDIKLILSQPARLLVPGQAGKYAGYSRGGTFYCDYCNLRG